MEAPSDAAREAGRIDLEPAHSSQANRRCPEVIVTASRLNRIMDRPGAGAIIAVPLTSIISWVFEFQVLLRAAEAESVSAG